jgi:hypothetical protein
MKSEILCDEIIFKIVDYNTTENDFTNYKFQESYDGMPINEAYESEHFSFLTKLKQEIIQLLDLLYKTSINDNFYFFDCPLQVYKNNYPKRFKEFKSNNIDADDIDFLKLELELLYNPYNQRILSNVLNSVFYSQFISNDLKFEISLQKKKEFIANKLKIVGWEFEQLPDEYVPNYYNGEDIIPGGLKFTKLESNKYLDTNETNSKYNFTFEKNKSFHYNLSKLTILPTATYENDKLTKISVGVFHNQKFITEISELKSILIEEIFSQTKSLESGYKLIFATKIYDKVKLKIEILQNQINLVKNNFSKADASVLDILDTSLYLNNEVFSILQNIIEIEGGSEIKEIDNIEKKAINDKKIHPIFLNIHSYQLFLDLIDFLSISFTNIQKRGNQAKFHAIWEVTDSKKSIFKPLILLDDYTSYLNKTYNTNYNSKSFSDGSRYHNEIKKFINN